MQKDLKKTTGAGVRVVAVSYDPVNVLKDFSDQHKITYPLLSDASSKTIDAYGIRNTRVSPRQDGIPHPGTFLIDGQGIIRAKLFYTVRKRHSTAELVEAANKIQ